MSITHTNINEYFNFEEISKSIFYLFIIIALFKAPIAFSFNAVDDAETAKSTLAQIVKYVDGSDSNCKPAYGSVTLSAEDRKTFLLSKNRRVFDARVFEKSGGVSEVVMEIHVVVDEGIKKYHAYITRHGNKCEFFELYRLLE